MTDKCQAPGLECEECRLKCQLPLIEAEKAQRKRRGEKMINHKDQLTMFSCHEDCKEICHSKDKCCQECVESLTCPDICNAVQYKNHIYSNNKFIVKELNELAEKQDNWLIAVAVQQLNKLAEENKLLKTDDALIVLKKIERLQAELARLQVALEATIAEKEKYKRAFEEVCRQFNYGDEADYIAMHDAFLELAKEGGNDETERASETP